MLVASAAKKQKQASNLLKKQLVCQAYVFTKCEGTHAYELNFTEHFINKKKKQRNKTGHTQTLFDSLNLTVTPVIFLFFF